MLGNDLVIEDATGRAQLNLSPNDAHPAAGMRVVVSGKSCAGWLTDIYDDICQSGASVQIISRTTNQVTFADTTIAAIAR